MQHHLQDHVSKRAIFASMLAGHLTLGTRPEGSGTKWSYAQFAGMVRSWQGCATVSPRSVSNWCCGRALPGSLVRINEVLFGSDTCEARASLCQAFRAARDEKARGTAPRL
jgi:hypothetical protein